MNRPSESDDSRAVDIGVAVVIHEDRYLIGLRPPDAPLGGLWEFPGGKIRSGETPESAAARECLEETGLRVEVQSSYPPVVYRYEHATVRLHFFACAPIEPPQSIPSRFRWVSAAELKNYKFPAANVPLIEQLAASKAITGI